MIGDLFKTLSEDRRKLRKFIFFYLIVPIAIIGSLVWVYYYQYYLLNKLLPFDNLTNRVALNIGTIQKHLRFEFADDDDEIFLLDTISGGIRQLTQDDHRNIKPFASINENKVYFLSDRDFESYSYRKYHLFQYDLDTKETDRVIEQLSGCDISATSNFTDLHGFNNFLTLIESRDTVSNLLIFDTAQNKCIMSKPVLFETIIWELSNDKVTIKEAGNIRSIDLRNGG